MDRHPPKSLAPYWKLAIPKHRVEIRSELVMLGTSMTTTARRKAI